MIEKIIGNTVTVVTVTSEENLRGLKSAIMGKHPGLMILEDSQKYTFPQKFTLIYDWAMMTCCIVMVKEEFVV